MKNEKDRESVQAPQEGGPEGRAGDVKVRGRHIYGPSAFTKLPSGPAPASSYGTFERWAMVRLSEETRCMMETSYSCVPLEGDPICAACYEAYTKDASVRDLFSGEEV